MQRAEAVIIRRSGGKVLEFKLIPPNTTSKLETVNNSIVGAMENISLDKFSTLLAFLHQNGRLSELEQMIKLILNKQQG